MHEAAFAFVLFLTYVPQTRQDVLLQRGNVCNLQDNYLTFLSSYCITISLYWLNKYKFKLRWISKWNYRGQYIELSIEFPRKNHKDMRVDIMILIMIIKEAIRKSYCCCLLYAGVSCEDWRICTAIMWTGETDNFLYHKNYRDVWGKTISHLCLCVKILFLCGQI